MPNEENGQCTIVINLSQDTEHMLFSDTEFKTQIQQDKTETINSIVSNIDYIKSEKVLEIRESMKILEDENELIVKFNQEFRLLREKYIGLASTNKLKRNIGEINFPFTGNCNKRRNPCNRI